MAASAVQSRTSVCMVLGTKGVAARALPLAAPRKLTAGNRELYAESRLHTHVFILLFKGPGAIFFCLRGLGCCLRCCLCCLGSLRTERGCGLSAELAMLQLVCAQTPASDLRPRVAGGIVRWHADGPYSQPSLPSLPRLC